MDPTLRYIRDSGLVHALLDVAEYHDYQADLPAGMRRTAHGTHT